ncbi:MAG: hypothetical protein HW411_804 [Gammaproteobacteria bacterium]|nr:hypothetical protein [Gammaproteobacteria bacterium]
MELKFKFIATVFPALLCLCLPSPSRAEWFKDPETGCAVWGEHSQPIVTVYWSGECVDGKASGKGIMQVHIDKMPFSKYEGDYKEGKADGYGVLTTPGESRYEGEFKDNNMHGYGVVISTDGKRLKGNYLNGIPQGTFTLTTPDGPSTEMEFDHGKRIK